jgi:hypothetical protein
VALVARLVDTRDSAELGCHSSRGSVLTAIEATGVPVVLIGEVRPSNEGITIVTNGALKPLTPPVRDEIARAFERGYEGL